MKFAFFGTDEFAVTVLQTLATKGFVPTLVVSTPDKPKGRYLEMQPTASKVWAQDRHIEVYQPDRLHNEIVIERLRKDGFDLFIVASYGKIIPESIFNMPTYKTLNIHPSLLPLLRGSSPVGTAILQDLKETGVTIIQIDAEMDHGPIVAQKKIHMTQWPTRNELEAKLAYQGALLLAETIPGWIKGEIKAVAQDESQATFTKLFEKEDAELDLSDDPYLNFRKIQAYEGWPVAYAFFEGATRKVRAKITEARFENSELIIEKVIPEGKKEMTFEDFERGL